MKPLNVATVQPLTAPADLPANVAEHARLIRAWRADDGTSAPSFSARTAKPLPPMRNGICTTGGMAAFGGSGVWKPGGAAEVRLGGEISEWAYATITGGADSS